jgi:serine/threonine protein kinase
MHCAHQHEFVHGDLSLDNIYVTSSGRLKIGNFAFAGVTPEDRRARAEYQAPELLKSGVQNFSTDVFALGVCFQKMVKTVGVARFPVEIRRMVEGMSAQEHGHRIPSMSRALELLGMELASGTVEDAQKIIVERFERTKTIQLQVEREVEKAKFRERLPSPWLIAFVAGLAYFSYVKIKPMLAGKNIAEASRTIASEAMQTTKNITGVTRMEEAKQMAIDLKKTTEEANQKKLSDADAASNGE